MESAMATPASAVETPASAVETPPKKSRQVAKFQDFYFLVRPYCGTYEFEWNPNYDHTKDCDIDDVEDVNFVAHPILAAIKYVNQIRESFGFDVDCFAPSWLGNGFIPISMTEAKLNNTILHDSILKGVALTITEINADLSGSGKSIELVKLVKVVKASPMLLLTLRVKEVAAAAAAADEGDDNTKMKIIQAIVFQGHGSMPPLSLEQWRFKPLEGDDFWYKAPPVDAAQYAAIYDATCIYLSNYVSNPKD